LQVDSILPVQQSALAFHSPAKKCAPGDEKKLTPFCLPEIVTKAHDTFIVFQFTVTAHAARQIYASTSNDALYTYDYYRATLSYALAQGWSAQLTYTSTNARDEGYTVLGKNLGDDQVVLSVARSF
jgi:hypothetical protein